MSVFAGMHGLSTAQNLPCEPVKPILNFTVSEEKIKYDLSKRSRNIGVATYKNYYPLGLFKGQFSSEISTEVQTRTLGRESCQVVTKLNLHMTFKPTIFIASEAQRIPCIYKRTLNHELQHYNIEKKYFNEVSSDKINALLVQKFQNIPVNYNNRTNISAYLRAKNEQFYREVSNLMQSATAPYHKQLDTIENYELESKLCSDKDNQDLMKLIQR